MISPISTLRNCAASQNVQGRCTTRALFASQSMQCLNLFSPVFAGTLPSGVDYEESFPNDDEFIAACCEGRVPYISVVGWCVIQGHQIQAPGHVSAFVSNAENQVGRYTQNLTIPHQLYYEDGTAVGSAAHGNVELQLEARCYFTCFIQGMAMMPIQPMTYSMHDDVSHDGLRDDHSLIEPSFDSAAMPHSPHDEADQAAFASALDQFENAPEAEPDRQVVVEEHPDASSLEGSTSTADSKLKAQKAKKPKTPEPKKPKTPELAWSDRTFTKSDRLVCKQGIMAVTSPAKDGFINTSNIRNLSAAEVVERLSGDAFSFTTGVPGSSGKAVDYVDKIMKSVDSTLALKSIFSSKAPYSNSGMYKRMFWTSGQFEFIISNSAVSQLIAKGGNPGADWLDTFAPEHGQYTRFVFAFKHEYFLPAHRASQGFVLVPVSSLSSQSATITSLLKAPISQMEKALRASRFDQHMWVKVGKKGVTIVSNDATPDDTSECVDLFAQGTDFFSPVVNIIINSRRDVASAGNK